MRIIRVFIGSPGGLATEREVARKVVDEVNLANSDYWGCQFRLVGWEDTIPGYQRPQSKINEDLDKCEYFLGVLWNRWGSRPSIDTSGYSSGFEEEYSRAVQRIENGQMKDLAIYFKAVDVPQGMEPGEEIKKVINLRQKFIAEKKVFFKDFLDEQEFRDLIRGKLTEIGWRETELLHKFLEKASDAEKAAPSDVDGESKINPLKSHLIDESAFRFVRTLGERSSDWDETRPEEVARFRLIASAIRRAGNDEYYIGNHDANLIYVRYADDDLSDQEIVSLQYCGISGFENQNVPLWRWVNSSKSGSDLFSNVVFKSIFGNDREKRNAIRILSLARQDIPSFSDPVNKRWTLKSWLAKESSDHTFNIALGYLGEVGAIGEIETLEECKEDLSQSRKEKIESCIVKILSRTGFEIAVERVTEKNIDKLDEGVVINLFSNPASLSTGVLKKCLTAKPDNLRLGAARILFKRDEIAKDSAVALLTDTSHEIRYIAAETLKKLGDELPPDIVKTALTIERRPGGLYFSPSARSEADETYFDLYLANRMREMPARDLEMKITDSGILASDEISTLYNLHPRKYQKDIRKNLDDFFKGLFDDTVKRVKDLGAPDEVISQMRGLEDFSRRKLCASVLNALCTLQSQQDLPLVRRVVDHLDIEASWSIIKYFEFFGNWSDIERILKLGDSYSKGQGLFENFDSKFVNEKAEAIYKIGKSRIGDLLNLDIGMNFKRKILTKLTVATIRSLPDDILFRELNRDDDDYRVIAALKYVLAFQKTRISSLLKSYIDKNSQRYYNSVHWLDLGASMPNALARRIAIEEMFRLKAI